MSKIKKSHHWTRDKDKPDEWSDNLVESFYGKRRGDPSRIIKKLNTATDEVWAAAGYKVRMFFNKLYDKYGIIACEELLTHTKDYPLLRTILYSMLGHRHFDEGNIEKMRDAYRESLKTADKIPFYNVHTNADKWRFSTNFYWARNDSDYTIKEECLVRAMSISTTYFHRELITTKFIRGYQWLVKNTKATEAIEKAKASIKQFIKDKRITQEDYDTISKTIVFADTKPGVHEFVLGNP
jgi:hypothetical protein